LHKDLTDAKYVASSKSNKIENLNVTVPGLILSQAATISWQA